MEQSPIHLTKREQQVLKLIHEGYTDSKISEQLNISQNTVRTHRRNMRKKFKAKNTPDMLRKAAQQNFL